MTRYLALAVFLLAAGTAHAAERTLDKAFTVAPGGALVVDAEGASIHVSGVDSNQVTVHMRFHGSDSELAATKLDAVQKDDTVTVTMRRQEKHRWFNWSSWNSDGKIEVTVPRNYRVGAHTDGGDIQLTDTTGSARLNTSGGDVTAKNVTGNVELRTSGGGILADNIKGDVDADTSGGDVRLLNVDGKIRGNTSGGSVRVSLVGANRGISATTSGGDIELTLPRATAGNVEATTSGGDINSDLPLLTNSQKEGRLVGSMNGGGEPIGAHTSGGSIRLRAAS